MPRLLLLLTALVLALPVRAQTLAVRADTLYTMAGAPIPGGVVLRSELLKAREFVRRGRTAPSSPSAPADTSGMPSPRTEARTGESPARPSGPPQGSGATDTPTRDLKLEALAALLRGERTALVSAHRANDIEAALRLQREFGFRMILDGGAEAYLVLDDLKAAGVPVFVHPTMLRAGGPAQNVTMEMAAKLDSARIPFAFTSAYEPYVPKTRVVLFEAAVAVGQGGLSRMAALHALTDGAARLLGLDARIGSLAPGRDADLVVWDGDPLEYTTHACTVVIGGTVVSNTCH